MINSRSRSAVLVLTAAAGAVSLMMTARAMRGQTPQQNASAYHQVKKVKIGGKGFWDYFAVDEPARRVYLSHNTKIEVVDADTGEVVGTVEDPKINGVHGVALVADLGKGFTSNGITNTSTIFDLKTLKPEATIPTGKHPDAIIYDPYSKQVFVFNGDSDNATVMTAATGKVAATIPLGGGPEFAASDGAGMVFVNLEDKNQVVAIDAKKLKVARRYPTAPCREPAGMAIDLAHARLFIGCHNKMLGVMDTKTGKIVSTVPIGAGVDANRFDPGTQLVFSSNGDDGTLTVIHEDTPDKYTVLENVKTEHGARTMEVDPKTHNVYLLAAELKKVPPTPENPKGHPMVVPDTLHLMIYAK